MRETLQQALTVLKDWDELIKHQYSGSSEAMTDMQHAAWKTVDVIKKVEAELAKPEQKQECETCSAKRKRLLDAGFLKSPLREELAEQSLDKKADNASELGLDYEPEPYCWVSGGNAWYAESLIPRGKTVVAVYTSPPRKEPEQKPVVCVDVKDSGNGPYDFYCINYLPEGKHLLYTSPPRKEWVGLTDDDVDWILGLAYADDMELIKTIEAKLKEKNA
jgi:hypothetical protein